MLDELARVLRYSKLASIFPEPDRIVALIAISADVVETSEEIHVLSDEPDNRVLEAAVAGGANLILTGDHAFLALSTFRGIEIVTSTEALSHFRNDDGQSG